MSHLEMLYLSSHILLNFNIYGRNFLIFMPVIADDDVDDYDND
jgi:hypothetical protein